MPQLQSISTDNNRLIIKDDNGIHEFDILDVPNNIKTAGELEDYLNNTWVPSVITDYQLRVHVFSFSPLSLTAFTANANTPIPANWWLE